MDKLIKGFKESFTMRHFLQGNGIGHILVFLSGVYVICSLTNHYTWRDFHSQIWFNPIFYIFVTFLFAMTLAMFAEIGFYFYTKRKDPHNASPVSWADGFSSAWGAILGLVIYWADNDLFRFMLTVFAVAVFRELYRLFRN